MLKKLKNSALAIRTAFFIAVKSIRRGSLAVKLVTIFILLLTFLNLLVVGGLLNGITEDVGAKVKTSLTGDVFIKPIKEHTYIQNTDDIFSILGKTTDVKYSPRLTSGATIEYGDATAENTPTRVNTVIAGIDPTQESQVTTIDQKVADGAFLDVNDKSAIVLGSSLVDGYKSSEASSDETLGNVAVGGKVRIRLPTSSAPQEFTVVGIVNSKSAVVDQRAFVNNAALQQLLKTDKNYYSEIAAVANNDAAAALLIQNLRTAPDANKNQIKSADEAIPSAIADVQKAFGMIGNIVGVTALLVGIVTIFVIVFVSASSRRRYIGILKAQGISAPTLVLSYIFQIFFYVLIGIALGLIILIAILQPYFVSHPISLPMADGQLFLPVRYVTARIVILFLASIISAFIPAWLIIRQNTLDAILGR